MKNTSSSGIRPGIVAAGAVALVAVSIGIFMSMKKGGDHSRLPSSEPVIATAEPSAPHGADGSAIVRDKGASFVMMAGASSNRPQVVTEQEVLQMQASK